MKQPVSRRDFLQIVGAIGGSAAVYQVAMGLGLAPVTAQLSAPDLAPVPKGTRRKVVILGAGLSGLTAAYELNRKGYEVQVLEATNRAGGRVRTLRGGDRVDEVGNPQLCRFDQDPDLYLNAGAARIPSHHASLIGYCKQFGVALAPFVNDNRSTWVHDPASFQGQRVRNREYVAGARGLIAELLAKSITPEKFAADFDREDYERLLDYLRSFGDLDSQMRYARSYRAGEMTHDFMSQSEPLQALDPREVLRTSLLRVVSYVELQDQAAMMLEPVGGMDRIVAGFMKQVGPLVRTQCEVASIKLQERGVDVVYRHQGKAISLAADYCLNCIPAQLLQNIEHNFPEDYAAACAGVKSGKLFKIAFQMKQRFWEDEGIYGGISWTTQDITQLWYPAHGIHRQKGILVGAYSVTDATGDKFGNMSPERRIEIAIQQGEKLHPGYGGYIENGISVMWHRVAHMMGCYPQWNEETRGRWLRRLQEPAGRHYLIGDQVSYHPGWQEGAIHSAYRALADIDQRVRAESTSAAA